MAGKVRQARSDKLSDKQRTDLALLIDKLESDRWYLTTFKEYEWNPALYNIAQPIDVVLDTPYASKPQRLRTLLKRITHVPAFFAAAQASIRNPTHEHMQLALTQAPGTLAVLAELGKAAQESILTTAEKNLFASRIANAGTALLGYVDFLIALDKQQQAAGHARARSASAKRCTSRSSGTTSSPVVPPNRPTARRWPRAMSCISAWMRCRTSCGRR